MQDEGSQLLALLMDASAARWWSTFVPVRAARRWRWAPRCATPGASTRSTCRSPPRGAEAAPGAQRPVQRAPGADRARTRRAHQAPGWQDRPRAGRCAVLGLGHAAAQPGPEVASVAQGGAGTATSSRRRSWPARPRLLKPGGRLVYATCSLLASENEGVRAGHLQRRIRGFAPLAAEQLLADLKVAGAETLVHGWQFAVVAASACNGRLLCCNVAEALIRRCAECELARSVNWESCQFTRGRGRTPVP